MITGNESIDIFHGVVILLTVDSLLTHTPNNPYSLKSHMFFKLPT